MNPLKHILSDPKSPLYRDAIEIYRQYRKPIPYDNILFKHKEPTFSKVIDDIWMGGAPYPTANIGKYFDCLAFCAEEYSVPRSFPDVQVISVKLNDDGTSMTKREARDALATAETVIEWIEDGLKILITCMRGMNRSGLITALALCKGPYQMDLNEVVFLIRKARGPNALSNPDFMRLLIDECSDL